MDFLLNHIEALIFCATSPLKLQEIQKCLSEMFEADVPKEDIEGALEKILKKYESDEYSFQVEHIGGAINL